MTASAGNDDSDRFASEGKGKESCLDGAFRVEAAAWNAQVSSPSQPPLTYWVSQKLILMGMGWMYFLAFYGAVRQNEGLMGSRGLVPSEEWFARLQEQYQCPSSAAVTTTTTIVERLLDPNCRRGFVDHPSVFWWLPLGDESMANLLLVGMTLSAVCGMGRSGSVALWLLLWILYFSVVTSASGTAFYAYGWESQVLETGFLCAFLCPNWVWPGTNVNRNATKNVQQQLDSASPLVLWLFRWLSFRISMGAGMIKIRGDSCWTQKTCLLYHFETQPLPSPLSFAFHFLPEWMLKRAVDLDLFVQVYTSWFVLLPTLPRTQHYRLQKVASDLSLVLVRLGGYIQTGFMANIALSGNMSMLNHLTILPALACLDDACYPSWLEEFLLNGLSNNNDNNRRPLIVAEQPAHRAKTWKSLRFWVDILLFVGILVLSIPVVENLLELDGRHQQMNASFGSFRLVNSYGAFGSVGKQRYEPILSVAYKNAKTTKGIETAKQQQQQQDQLEWIEIEFPCKPGSLDRRPCFCAPYHYRLDWNIWFLGFKPHSHYLNRRESWLYHLLAKILGKDDNGKNNDFHNNNNADNHHPSHNGNWWGTMPNQRRLRPWLDLLDSTSKELLEQRGSPLYAKVDAAPLWELLPKYLRMMLWGNALGGSIGSATTTTVQWWNRHYEEPLLPVVAFDFDRGQLVRATVQQ